MFRGRCEWTGLAGGRQAGGRGRASSSAVSSIGDCCQESGGHGAVLVSLRCEEKIGVVGWARETSRR